ncbi:MAG: 5'/3'-nucleotidase SurE [Clostridiales bacterium]|nr:5'/3'-nucleotidase SurE [Clostridiales bacterium]
MKILVVNDDGIDAEGIKHLVEWAKTKGEVCVFAPKLQQSGTSHSIEIHNSYEVKKVDAFDGVEAYSVDSTPADCVRVAILGMNKKFDLVLSGINRGFNLGADIHYSGTVGACFEAANCGVRSVALSSDYSSFDNAIKNLDRIFAEIEKHKLLELTQILNVNVPADGDEILITKVGGKVYSDTFDFLPNDMVMPRLINLYKGTRNLELDTDGTFTGHITISPLRVDSTDYSAHDKIIKN